MNKFLLGSILVLLAIALVGYITPVSSLLADHAYTLFTLAENLAIVLMLVNGTFIRTRWFKVAIFFIGLLVLGAVIRIMHLPGAEELFYFSFVALFVVYLVHFLQKKSLKRNDILKMLTAVCFLAIPSVVSLNLGSEEFTTILVYTIHVVFWVTLLDFLYTSFSQGSLYNK